MNVFNLSRGKLSQKKAELELLKIQFKLFCLLKQPVLFMLGISLASHFDKICVRLPFHKRNQNYLKQMAFAPILAGAECAAAFPLVSEIYLNKLPIKVIIKSGDFEINCPLKTNGTFICEIDNIDTLVRGDWKRKTLQIPVSLLDEQSNKIGHFKFDAILRQR